MNFDNVEFGEHLMKDQSTIFTQETVKDNGGMVYTVIIWMTSPRISLFVFQNFMYVKSI